MIQSTAKLAQHLLLLYFSTFTLVNEGKDLKHFKSELRFMFYFYPSKLKKILTYH